MKGTKGTDRYKRVHVPKPKKVQIGTEAFRLYLLYLGEKGTGNHSND